MVCRRFITRVKAQQLTRTGLLKKALFEVEALENEKLDLPAYGEVSSLVLRPTTTSAQLFSRKLPEMVWVSTDPRRLLLRIDARVAIGSVHVVLNRVEGPGSDFWVKPAAETKK